MAFSFDWAVRVTDIVMGIAVLLGPILAVVVTLWAQNRHEKRAEKQKLFITLIAERQALGISQDVAKALNTIDVVFSGRPPIILAWHRYYAQLGQPYYQERAHSWLELLTAMASELGYSIQQTDLDKFYLPQGHADDAQFQRNVAQQWARVLENTERLLLEPRQRG